MADQACPNCGRMVPDPKSSRRKCPHCKVWLGYFAEHPGGYKLIMLAEEARRRMDAYEDNAGQLWAANKAAIALSEFGISPFTFNELQARNSTWRPHYVAIRLLHPIAMAMPIGTDKRRSAMLTLAGFAMQCGEPAAMYQRAFHTEECLDYKQGGFTAAVEVKLGVNCGSDPECISRIGTLYPINEAALNPPIPCSKAWCKCWLSPVFLDENEDKQPQLIAATNYRSAPQKPVEPKQNWQKRWLIIGGVIFYIVALAVGFSSDD